MHEASVSLTVSRLLLGTTLRSRRHGPPVVLLVRKPRLGEVQRLPKGRGAGGGTAGAGGARGHGAHRPGCRSRTGRGACCARGLVVPAPCTGAREALAVPLASTVRPLLHSPVNGQCHRPSCPALRELGRRAPPSRSENRLGWAGPSASPAVLRAGSRRTPRPWGSQALSGEDPKWKRHQVLTGALGGVHRIPSVRQTHDGMSVTGSSCKAVP